MTKNTPTITTFLKGMLLILGSILCGATFVADLYWDTFNWIGAISFILSLIALIGSVAFIPLAIWAFRRKGKFKITFMQDGQAITKICKRVSASDTKMVFEDKKSTYSGNPKEFIRIEKANRPLFLILLTSLGIMFLLVMGRVIANVWPTPGSEDYFVDVGNDSFYGDTMNPRDFQD